MFEETDYVLNTESVASDTSPDKIFFFLAAGFPDQKFPANFFYKYEFWL